MIRNPLTLLPRPSLGGLTLAAGLLSLAFGVGVRTAGVVDAAPAVSPAAPLSQQLAAAPGSPTLLDQLRPSAGASRPGYADVVEPALRAVVNIQSTKVMNASAADPRARGQMPPDHYFFWGPFGPNQQPEQKEDVAGSGVIVRADGVILTNNHVVEDAKEVLVTFADKRELKAKVVGTDPKTDIAVIKVDATGLPTLPIGKSSDLRVGDLVFAIGNPFSVGRSVTMGIVSATERTRLGLTDNGYEDFIQTDAAINPGNSGGALVDGRGELIGINTAIVSRGSMGNQGLAFAVPIDMASRVMEQILRDGKVTRSQVGVIIQRVSPAMARALKLDGTSGALVSQVLDDSPAQKAGLKVQDVIVSLDGKPIEDSDQFRLDVSSRTPGTRVRLGLLRDGSRKDVDVTLTELRDRDAAAPAAAEPEEGASRWGVSVQDLTAAFRERLELDADAQGVVVTDVENGGPADRAGLQPGDVVTQLNRQPVRSVADFKRLAKSAGKDTILLLVQRQGSQLFLALEP